MVLKTNNESCYFYNNDTGEKSKRYIDSPNLSFIYLYNGEEKKLDGVHIDPRTNVIIGKDNSSTFIIDDGYRNSMIRAGYLVYRDYDKNHITDKTEGNILHEKILESVSDVLFDYCDNGNNPMVSFTDGKSEDFYLKKDGYKFNVTIYDNIEIVKINEERKINGLQFYPFDKNMDNYGTLYITIHCQRYEDTDVKNTVIADSILKYIIDNTEDIRYISMDIKQPLYFTLKEEKSPWEL